MSDLRRTASALEHTSVEPDPRELTEAFQRLPPEVQDLKREAWIDEEVEWERVEQLAGRDKVSVILQGVAVFAAAELALAVPTGLHFTSFSLALLIGVAVGYAWWRLDAGVLLSPILAMPLYMILQGMLWRTPAGHGIDVLVGPLLVGFPSGYLGMQRGFSGT